MYETSSPFYILQGLPGSNADVGLAASKIAFDKLPPDLQKIVLEAGDAVNRHAIEMMNWLPPEDIEARKSILADPAYDIRFCDLREDPAIFAKFEEVTAKLMDEWLEKTGKEKGWKAYQILRHSHGKELDPNLVEKYGALYGMLDWNEYKKRIKYPEVLL